MELANPYYLENIYADQPYSSMLLIAPQCDFKCDGCQNIHLKNDFKDIKLDFLIKEFKNNPFFEGITVGGLEIFLSGENFLKDLIKFIQMGDIKKITIYKRFDKDYPLLKKIIEEIKILQVDELYLKYGEYKKNRKSKIVQIKNWSIKLASDNQNFIKII